MTQVSIDEALLTMLYAVEDAIELIYQHQHSNIKHKQHYVAELQGALEAIAHACVQKSNKQGAFWTDAAWNAAENYWGQHDEDGITLVYADGSKIKLRFQ